MALFKGVIQKRLNGLTFEKWVNVYHIEALGPASALDALELIAGLEQNILSDAVTIERLTAQLTTGGATSIRTLSLDGEVVGDINNLVPMFNTVRVVLGDEFERSESKYLRACIYEANVAGFNLSSELRTFIQENYANPLLEVLGLRGPNGEEIVTANVQTMIQMRQIGWHRRSRPGFKRGWVPV